MSDEWGILSGENANLTVRERQELIKKNTLATSITGAPHFLKDIHSTFDVRPVSGVDTLLNGEIRIEVPQGAACANPGNDAPLTPWTQNFGAVSANNPGAGGQVAPNETVGGTCVQTTVYTRLTGSSKVSAFAYQLKTNDGLTRPGTFNAYGYQGTTDTNGVLVVENIGFSIPTIDFDDNITVVLKFPGQIVIGNRYTAIFTSTGDAVPNATGLSMFASFVTI